MRQLLPVEEWVPSLPLSILNTVEHVLGEDPVAFDVQLRRGGKYARAQVSGTSTCYHFVWMASSSDVATAAVRASLHPSGNACSWSWGPHGVEGSWLAAQMTCWGPWRGVDASGSQPSCPLGDCRYSGQSFSR